MVCDQLTGHITCPAISFAEPYAINSVFYFFLPTRSYRVLIAVNHGLPHHLFCDAQYRVLFIFQRFPRFSNNPIAPAGSLQEVPPVLRKMARDMQIPLVLQRFSYVSGHLRGVIFSAQHVTPAAGSRKACFTSAFPPFLNNPIALFFCPGPKPRNLHFPVVL